MDNRDIQEDSRSNWTPSWGAGIALLLFLAIFVGGIALSTWQEVTINTEDTLSDTLFAIAERSDAFGVIAGGVSFGFHEIWRFAVVFAKVLEDNRRQRFKAAHEEGLAQGHKQGREEGHAEGHAQGREEGHAEGREQGRMEAREDIINRLRARGVSEDVIRSIEDEGDAGLNGKQ